MLAAAMQDQQEPFGVQYLTQGHFNTKPGESNQQPSDNKTLAAPLRRFFKLLIY